VGIALYPLDGANAEGLLQHADLAMYKAKQQGKNNYQFLRDQHELLHYQQLHAH
jgi:GGDEF domain-containing protein